MKGLEAFGGPAHGTEVLQTACSRVHVTYEGPRVPYQQRAAHEPGGDKCPCCWDRWNFSPVCGGLADVEKDSSSNGYGRGASALRQLVEFTTGISLRYGLLLSGPNALEKGPPPSS
jgi:hypothetical protein